jgi:activator of 2-hydroxyglutaryl-CoA dehydratase
MEEQIQKLIGEREVLKSELSKLLDDKSEDFQRVSDIESKFNSITEEILSLYEKFPGQCDISILVAETSAMKKTVREFLHAAHKSSTPLRVADVETAENATSMNSTDSEITFHPRLNVTSIEQAGPHNKSQNDEEKTIERRNVLKEIQALKEEKEDREDELSSAMDSGPEGVKHVADIMNRIKQLCRTLAELYLRIEDEESWKRSTSDYEKMKEKVQSFQNGLADKYDPSAYEQMSDSASIHART